MAKEGQQTRQRRRADDTVTVLLYFFALIEVCLLASHPEATAFTISSTRTPNSRVIRSNAVGLQLARYHNKATRPIRMACSDNNSHMDENGTDAEDAESASDAASKRTRRIRERVADLARRIVLVPIKTASSITPMPQAVASVLKDATLNAVDMAVEEGSLTQTRD